MSMCYFIKGEVEENKDLFDQKLLGDENFNHSFSSFPQVREHNNDLYLQLSCVIKVSLTKRYQNISRTTRAGALIMICQRQN